MKEFKVIVAGSRDFTNYEVLKQKLDVLLANKERVVIVSGGARGADKMGERYASERNLSCEIYPADWDKFGKGAGYRRNEQMAKVADGLVAFWDGKSKGTSHMIELMQKLNKSVRIVKF